MVKRKIIIGSRDSKLAVAQTKLIMEDIKRVNPELELELITRKTTGDLILNERLDKIGGKGLFVKELDQALLAGEIDIAVHSLKDMPMGESKELPIVAMYKRGDPRDVLVLPMDYSGDCDLNHMERIGTSSARRMLQITSMYQSAEVKSVRGNIITRLNKLDQGEFSALILAAAGLQRVGLTERISRYFSVEELIPAAGQGILAIQARSDLDISFLEAVNHMDTVYEATAERSFVTVLEGGCSSPIAAHARVIGEELKLTGLNFDENTNHHFIQSISGDKKQAKALGYQLAMKMKGAISE